MTVTDHCESMLTLTPMEAFLRINVLLIPLKCFAFSSLFQLFPEMFGICFCYPVIPCSLNPLAGPHQIVIKSLTQISNRL